MKSAGKTLFVFISLFFLVSFVSAVEVKKTEFVIVTDPYQNITAVVQDEDGADLQTFAGRARKFGEYRFTYHGLVDKVKLSVSIVNNITDEVVAEKEFGPYTVGNLVNVTLKVETNPGQGAAVVNTPNPTPQSDPNISVAEASAASANPLTGRAISDSLPSLPQSAYYVVAGFLGLGLLIFILRKKMTHNSKRTPKEPDHQKMFDKAAVKEPVKEEFKPENAPTVVTPNKEAETQELQQKISELQKQLESIRGEEKLIKLQRQLDREKNELKRLQEDKQFSNNQNNNNPGNGNNLGNPAN